MKKLVLIALTIFALSSHLAFAAKTYTGVVNINTATVEQLEVLPGVGPAKALAIVEQRKKQSFQKKDELLLVKGIGDKLFAKIAPHVDVQGSNTLIESAATKTN